ncbi:ABC transporter permease subunit [Prochlorococcus sp. MIT 1223]|uniref:ABC transporter permease subunit n=1 Tax=Prochlorococcus sp. MIT 1223 TaxID=3096217 RepID=UPI002A760523|nr:ABC transporter permease subunit [Prochlorococcus sp. MIT 1223]
MKIFKGFWLQVGIVSGVIVLLSILINNISINLIRTGLGFSFSWLTRPASFALAEYALPYSPSDSYAWAIFIGWLNSLKVIFLSLLIATLIGFFVGLARTGTNALLRVTSAAYVMLIRQTPLLLQLMCWYFVGFLGIKGTLFFPARGILAMSNQGLDFLGVTLSAEFSALLLGLSVFTGAYISEVVRGGINSVEKGQWEAFRSLGLSESDGLYKIIIPQALPAILPGLTSQYLNLAKNSTLAIAVGYSDIYAISDTVINQTGRAIEGFILLLLSFLLLNLIISNAMEVVNKFILNYQRR